MSMRSVTKWRNTTGTMYNISVSFKIVTIQHQSDVPDNALSADQVLRAFFVQRQMETFASGIRNDGGNHYRSG